MTDHITRSIIKTLCYAQIFSYPLTQEELWKYLITDRKISKKSFAQRLSSGLYAAEKVGEFFVLRGDRRLVEKRIERQQQSARKFKKAYIIGRILFCIPTIKLVGVSGSLSMRNAKQDDDIDLFFITAKGTLWTTRLVISAILSLFGQKRIRLAHYAKDKICPNMFMSEEKLRIKKKDQNIYMAHEVAQMKVLFSRDEMYKKFLSQNAWVLSFMPNAFSVSPAASRLKNSSSFLFNALRPIEKTLYFIQYIYMKKRITREVVSESVAAFHPAPHKTAVLELYSLKTTHQITSRNKVKQPNLASNLRQIN